MSRARPHELEAQRFAALSHPTRLIVFRAVMRAGPAGLPAGALADEAGVTPSNLSAHLNLLTQAGLISVRAKGRQRIFAPQVEVAAELMVFLSGQNFKGEPEMSDALPRSANG